MNTLLDKYIYQKEGVDMDTVDFTKSVSRLTYCVQGV